MSRPTCSTCRFWWRHQYPEGQAHKGFCNRYPPSIHIPTRDLGEHLSVWPTVLAHDWCGEHAPVVGTPAPREDRVPPVM